MSLVDPAKIAAARSPTSLSGTHYSLRSGPTPKHSEQAIVELALRQQLATYSQKRSKPKITPLDRRLLDRPLPLLAPMEALTGHRQARYRHPLASKRIQTLLAMDIEAGGRAAADTT
jgi:hypothetical protein